MAEGGQTRRVLGTAEYVLFTDELLGRGSMGSVYLGRHRKRGTKFAGKVYNKEVVERHASFIARELDILTHMEKHNHIANLVAVETEKRTGDQVLIMELCQGGSLQDILLRPENYYGLNEEEFMLVFQHIGKALLHLYKKRIVHRDIKPGNILLHISADGRHIYKLTDFGTSRTLSEEESFRTICGTEEYLHPALHHQAFISKTQAGSFGFEADFWSFGVTMYQCATGDLPFRPYNGIRSDKKMMSKLMLDKPPGSISQIENQDGGIFLFNELPDHTRLNRCLKRSIAQYLADMLETQEKVDPQILCHKLMDHFEKTRIDVFNVNLCEDLTIFSPPNQSMKDLETMIVVELVRAGLEASNLSIFVTDGFFVRHPKNLSECVDLETRGILLFTLYGSNTTKLKYFQPPDPDDPESRKGTFYAGYKKTTYCNMLYMHDVLKTCKALQKKLVIADRELRRYYSDKRDLFHQKELGKHETVKLLYNFIKQQPKSPRLQFDEIEADIATTDSIFTQQQHDQLRPDIQLNRSISCDTQRCIEKSLVILNEAEMLIGSPRGDEHNDQEVDKYNIQLLKMMLNRQLKILVEHCFPALISIHRDAAVQYKQFIPQLKNVTHANSQSIQALLKLLKIPHEEDGTEHNPTASKHTVPVGALDTPENRGARPKTHEVNTTQDSNKEKDRISEQVSHKGKHSKSSRPDGSRKSKRTFGHIMPGSKYLSKPKPHGLESHSTDNRMVESANAADNEEHSKITKLPQTCSDEPNDNSKVK